MACTNDILYATSSNGMATEDQSGLIADGADGMRLNLTYGNLGENAFTANITFSLPSNLLEFVSVDPVRTCIISMQ